MRTRERQVRVCELDDEACDDAGESETCNADCTPTGGDGVILGGEECDDANTTAGNGCSSACAVESGFLCAGEPSQCSAESRCGDGSLDAGETCDDDNTAAGDGGSVSCATEPGFLCQGSPSVCISEQTCDDVNGGDACLDSDVGAGTLAGGTEDCGCATLQRSSKRSPLPEALLAFAWLRRRRATA